MGDYMKKDGFISMAIVYSFIIVFILLLLSLLGAYSFRNNMINNQIDEVKIELNKGYDR
jgi:thiol:disulfide interchange protein